MTNNDQDGVLRLKDGIPIPPLDPLRCDQAKELYDKELAVLTAAEKFMLLLHVAGGRNHDPVCPAHDPTLLKQLKGVLGIEDLLAQ